MMFPRFKSPVFCLLFIVFVSGIVADEEPSSFGKSLNPAEFGPKSEKLSHLHFYFHDIVSGPKATAIPITKPFSNTSHTGFGSMVMIDDPLTEKPEISSKIIGRAQGIYASASLGEVGLLMTLNFVFLEGEYMGSTLSVLGRNTVMSTIREMPIVGGTGIFRFARGYAQAKTHWINLRTGDAIVEYNVFVTHY